MTRRRYYLVKVDIDDPGTELRPDCDDRAIGNQIAKAAADKFFIDQAEDDGCGVKVKSITAEIWNVRTK